MFKILDGREHFYQWDLDRKLIVEDASINQVHFCNKTDDESLVVEVYEIDGERVADVPNILLQDVWRICAYGYDSNYTKHMARFDVVARSKPQSYVYTETEVLNYNTLLERINKVDEDIEGVVEEYLEANPPQVDLDNYYTIAQTDKAIYDAVNSIDFPDIPETDLSDYYTKEQTDKVVADAVGAIDIPEAAEPVNEVYIGDTAPIDEDVELWIVPNAEGADYALKSDIPSLEEYALKSEIPTVPDVSGFITMSEVEAKGYQTEAQVNALINTALGVIENGTY